MISRGLPQEFPIQKNPNELCSDSRESCEPLQAAEKHPTPSRICKNSLKVQAQGAQSIIELGDSVKRKQFAFLFLLKLEIQAGNVNN